jgi:hypothetical protein
MPAMLGSYSVSYSPRADGHSRNQNTASGREEQNVEDIVLEQEKARKSVKSQRAKAEVWLVSFLAGAGEVPSRFVVTAGKEAGYSRTAIHAARREMEDRIEVINLPVIPRQTAWRLIPE